jgi:putative ABC transport system permease protein
MLLANYIRVAWRNLTSKKLYSGIKIGGLAVGLCVGIMILLYVSHESSFDRWHKDSDKIFSLKNRTKLNTDTMQLDHFSYFVASALQQQNSAVGATLRIANSLGDGAVIQSEGAIPVRDAEHNLLFADSNFFSFFSYKLLAGNAASVLQQPFSAVISEDMAKKYFGSTEVIGKRLKYNDKYVFQVNGLMKNMPSNSNMQADCILSVSSFNSIDEFRPFITENQVTGGVFQTYLKLRSATDHGLVTANTTKLMTAGGFPGRAVLQPITETHILEAGRLRYLKLFPPVAGLILLMALINYMSLTTARALGRAKEISVRKTLGASYKHIAWQFYIESALYALLAFAGAIVLFLWLHATLFSFLDIKIDEHFLFTPLSFLIYFGLLFITILLSGSYPAFILSRYNPATGFRLGKQIAVRKVLTVVQFVIAGVLIVCSVIIRGQLHYFKNADTGIDKNNVLMIPFQSSMGAHYQSFRSQVGAMKEVQGTGTARYPLYRGFDMFFVSEGDKEPMSLYTLHVDEPLVNISGIQWKYKPQDKLKIGADNTIVLNETAVKRLNLGDSPVGKFISMGGKKEVVGIVKDFNFNSLHGAIGPLALYIEKDNSPVWGLNTPGCMFVKLLPHSNIASVLGQIKKIYGNIDPLSTFEYRFLDDTFNSMYKAEEQLMNIFDGFTVITILIAALGLLGLATSSAEQRTKEIGVRKTLGANVTQLVLLLSKEFIKLVLVSLVLATPLAWYLMKQWLQQFAYRVEMKMWMFMLSAALVLTVAIIAIGWQVLKAALINPVKALKITSD